MGRNSVALATIAFTCFFCAAWAQGPSTAADRAIDLRLGIDLGSFVYAQNVDGGYFVDGEAYDLDWYALEAGIALNAEYDLPMVRGLGLGLGGIGFLAFDPRAVDTSASVALDSGQIASGACVGASASYAWSRDWRVNAIAGYGATGLAEFYGGDGPALTLAVERIFPRSQVLASIGLRGMFMYLSYPETEATRGEHGWYYSLMAEASMDWMR
jgi:hypothetical protein